MDSLDFAHDIPWRAAPNVSIHLLDDGAILFEPETRLVFAANATATAVWFGLQQKFPPRMVADGIADRFGMDRAMARSYVAQTLWQWRSARRATNEDDAACEDMEAPDGADMQAISKRAALPTDIVTRHQVLDTEFQLRYADRALHELIEGVLAPLKLKPGQPRHTVVLDIGPHEGGLAVTEGEDILNECTDETFAAVMVKATMLERALYDCCDLAAVHAAAARRGGDCVLLPGASGAGKSSLAAGLAGEGFELLGDDTIVLTRGALQARPVPFGLCIKEGGRGVVSSRFPMIDEAPLHERPDRKQVRFLTPPDVAFAGPSERCRIGWVVFPEYMADGGTEIIEISKSTAAQRLMQCFVPLGDGLSDEDVEALTALLQGVPCYALRVSSLTDAVKLIGNLVE